MANNDEISNYMGNMTLSARHYDQTKDSPSKGIKQSNSVKKISASPEETLIRMQTELGRFKQDFGRLADGCLPPRYWLTWDECSPSYLEMDFAKISAITAEHTYNRIERSLNRDWKRDELGFKLLRCLVKDLENLKESAQKLLAYENLLADARAHALKLVGAIETLRDTIISAVRETYIFLEDE